MQWGFEKDDFVQQDLTARVSSAQSTALIHKRRMHSPARVQVTNSGITHEETIVKDHSGCKRAFSHTGAAWYGNGILPNGQIVDSINLGFYAHEGGTSGEFEINWKMVGGELTPQLTAFNDSWHALNECRDLPKSAVKPRRSGRGYKACL
ncbi:hypothetical protein [Sinimarinibacterium sp. NLF-5-8]|uniref:hypothetical protein n=1 Tax=Sinimarinibacterium sp. NLF-5-8 TaxID=2698684 RepID=UPI00137BF8D7|nr:hypothetical protein [Sinimarinibacterium sp. NLF-5-8]QHS09099.1 hypothetical protein GT972_02325 [Sinimarinibacterium sp. NLF-5-8]